MFTARNMNQYNMMFVNCCDTWIDEATYEKRSVNESKYGSGTISENKNSGEKLHISPTATHPAIDFNKSFPMSWVYLDTTVRTQFDPKKNKEKTLIMCTFVV